MRKPISHRNKDWKPVFRGDWDRKVPAKIQGKLRPLIQFGGTMWKDLTSSNLKQAFYNFKKRQLEIEFNSGGVYRYYHVGPTIYYGLIGAGSHGKFFWAAIRRGPYRYRRVA